MSTQHFRTTWAGVNKGLAFVLIGIPIALLMSVIYEAPLPTHLNKCMEYDGNQTRICDYTTTDIWPFIRLEITFMVIFFLSMLSYCWRYNTF